MAKYEVYAEYKDSGVEWLGDLPSHWFLKKHKYIAVFSKGRNPELLLDNYADGLYPYLSMDSLRGKADSKYAEYKKGMVLVEDNQPLIIWDGSNSGEFVLGKEGILSSTMASSSLIYNIENKFYWYVCICIEPEMRKHATGMGIPHVNGEELRGIAFPLPDIQEQQKIVNFLDYETAQIDTLIAKQEKLIELLKEKRQAVISHAVTKGLNPNVPMKDSGVEWLGQVPEHWGVSSIGYYAKVTNGTTPSKANLSYWDKAEIPWLSSGEVNQYYIFEASEYITTKALAECSLELLPIGTVVMGMIGQGKTRGLSAITKMEATINQNLAALVAYPKLNNEYLHYYLQAAYDYMREEGRGGNQAALNCEIIRKFPITIPSYQEQLKIVEQIKKLSITYKALINKAESAIQLMQERRTALISSAVTGKIDVRNWQNPNKNNEAKTEFSA